MNELNSRSQDADCLEFVQHLLVMRGGPEDAPALRTPEKHLLRGKDIGRDQRLDRVLGFWLQDAIAFQAAREKSIAGPQAAFANDLAELLAIIIAVDENKL